MSETTTSSGQGASLRYAVIVAFAAGMLVAGVVVPLATRSSERPVASIGAAPTTPLATDGSGAHLTTPDASAPGGDVAGGGPARTTVGGGSGAGATATVVRTASDVGVTADTVKIGAILTDLAGATKLIGGLAGASAQDQQDALQAFIDEANRAGGINGRKITTVYTSYDPVAGDSTPNCNKLAEDDKVFAIVSWGMFGPPVLCVTQQHGVPLVNTGGFTDEYYRKSRGLLFTIKAGKARANRSTASDLDAQGVLKGRTIGVFTSRAGDDDVAVDEGLVPTLNQLGHKVAHISRMGTDGSPSQIPIEVNQMRSKGVDLIFLNTNVVFDTQFVQQADSQGYRPLYALSDAEDNISDFFLSNMPSSFQAVGITANRTGEQRVGTPEPALDAECRGVVEKATGKQLARGTAGYEVAMSGCNQIRLLVRGATAAGIELTRTRFSAGMQSLGAFPQAYAGGGSFGSGKFDAADYIRTVRSDMECKCWKPADGFRRSRF